MATQIQLSRIARNGDFQARVYYLMVKAAVAKLNQVTPTDADKLLGQKILDGVEPIAAWALATVTNTTIAAGAHEEDGSTIVDGDLEFTVNSLWTAFSL